MLSINPNVKLQIALDIELYFYYYISMSARLFICNCIFGFHKAPCKTLILSCCVFIVVLVLSTRPFICNCTLGLLYTHTKKIQFQDHLILYICSTIKGGYSFEEDSHSFFSLYQGVQLPLSLSLCYFGNLMHKIWYQSIRS